MSKTSTTKLASFAQACELTGHNPGSKYTPEEQSDIMLRAACKLLNIQTPDLGWRVNDYTTPLIAHRNLQIIRNAVTGNWKADYNNFSQLKWYPWFRMDKPGFRFSAASYGGTGSSVGSWLDYETWAQAELMGQTCIALYRDLYGGGQLAS